VKMRRISVVLLLVGLFAAGCTKKTLISSILISPEKYGEKEVTIVGKVTEVYHKGAPLGLGIYGIKGGFRIQDLKEVKIPTSFTKEKGDAFVSYNGSLPMEGKIVEVRGICKCIGNPYFALFGYIEGKWWKYR